MIIISNRKLKKFDRISQQCIKHSVSKAQNISAYIKITLLFLHREKSLNSESTLELLVMPAGTSFQVHAVLP